MRCDNCGNKRIVELFSHAKDMHTIRYRNFERRGYLPDGFGIGRGDDTEIDYCLECGKIQGSFPITDESIEEAINEDRFDDEELFEFADTPLPLILEEAPDPEVLEGLVTRYGKLHTQYEEDAEAMSEDEWREYKDIRNALEDGKVSDAVWNAFTVRGFIT